MHAVTLCMLQLLAWQIPAATLAEMSTMACDLESVVGTVQSCLMADPAAVACLVNVMSTKKLEGLDMLCSCLNASPALPACLGVRIIFN
jgi:hypothetical protein